MDIHTDFYEKLNNKLLRYRAFDKNLKRMFDVRTIDFIRNTVELQEVFTNGNIGVHECFFDDVELMRSIGYYDINKIEIFEGDRVCALNFWKCTSSSGSEVSMSINGAVIELCDGSYELLSKFKFITVLGHIYDNQ